MDLRERLAQLDKLTRKPAVTSVGSSAPVARAAGVTETTLAELGLDGHDQPGGMVWYREHEDSLVRPPEQLPDLTGLFGAHADGPRPLAGVLFLDTETTGLAGGTGTLVFQLGVSWWDGNLLRTRQYFLPDPKAEPALLDSLARLAREFSHVVTYNGASFDLPLLRTRALLNRIADPLGHLIGWDLLVPARRLWRNRLIDCRQQTVEKHVCGRSRRPGDIDGGIIPLTWFEFLRTGQAGLLGNVLTHNHRDMVGMARIFARVCMVAGWLAAVERTGAWPPAARTLDCADAWALGRICERRLARAAAGDCFRRACRVGWGDLADENQRRRFRRDAIRNLKRRQDWDLVEELINDGLECKEIDMALHVEAAILYEHRLPDLERAHQHAVLVGDFHRIARLERRLGRRSE